MEKSGDEFPVREDYKDGLFSWCRPCLNLYYREKRSHKEFIEPTVDFQNCSICGKNKPASDYTRSKSYKSGLDSRCKECQKLNARTKRSGRKLKKWALKAEGYFDCNVCNERLLLERRARPDDYTCKDCYNKKQRENKPYDPVKAKQRRLKDPEKTRARGRLDKHARRARMVNAPGKYRKEELIARFDFFGNRCIYCKSPDNLTVEHLIPLSRGGTNWPSNLAPSCFSCNSRKKTKTHREFLEYREKYL